MSDFETDASSLSNSENQGLPFDVDRDERLTRPDEYFRELEDLEASIAGNSGLFLMSSQNRRAYPKTNTFRLRFAFECYSMGPDSRNSEFTSFDQHIMAYCNDRTRVNGELDHGLADLAFHVLECRNLMLSVVSNIERMKQQKYCQGFMSMLTLDNKRSNVVNLVKLPTKEIRMLHRGFEDAIGQALSLMESSRLEKSLKVRGVRERISAKVQQMLQHCGLPLGFSDFGDWRRLVMVLDLAVISYAGTHQEDFAGRFLGESLDLAKITPAWTYDPLASKNIMLRRRRLRCLDKLLQSPVWVFQDSSKWADRGALYLSTDLEAFADVWGPVWSVKPNDDAASIILYRVGFGLLCRWPPEFSVGRLRTDEVFCHWISSEEPPSKQKHFEHFPEGARLLIGAGTLIENTTSQLKETLDCSTRTSKVIRELRSTHRLEELGTSPDEKYLAEECVTAQLGYSGVTLGGQRTYKRRTGVTLKQAICDEWKNSNSSSRNPAILERWIGLEVSFCSGNARRRRLKHILGSTTMMNWLDSCKTNDTAFPCEDAFRDAIQSRDCRAFRTLWSQRREWRKDLGQLVSWCLEGLAHSKLDAAGDLHVLWMPKPEKRMIVRIRQNRHAWTGFLTDSRDHCAMAVMSGKCLSSDYKYASYCQSKAQLSYSILETALVINEMAPQPKSLELRPCEGDKVSHVTLPDLTLSPCCLLHPQPSPPMPLALLEDSHSCPAPSQKKQPHYVIAHLAPGEKLQVHSSGRLRVRETFARTRLLCEWERGVSRKMFEATQQLGRTVGIEQHHHWELKDDDDSPVKSIPLFVISQCRDGR